MKKIILPLFILFAANTLSFPMHLPKAQKTANNNIIVEINFYADSSYFLKAGHDTASLTLAHQIFGDQLTYNLDNDFANSRYNVSFYTASEIAKYRLKPDIIVDVSMLSLGVPVLKSSGYSISQPVQNFAENTVYNVNSFGGGYNGTSGPPGALGPYYTYGTATLSQHLHSLHADATFSSLLTNTHSNTTISSEKIKTKFDSYQTGSGDETVNSATENIFEKLYKRLYSKIKTEVTKGLQKFDSRT
ncbi:MAG TPA: hypothetical protein VG847_14450 [Chitinophagaceae bacterium]|nr:hypothetical protein [Chitinophagaceae bacterium]